METEQIGVCVYVCVFCASEDILTNYATDMLNRPNSWR